MNKQQNDLQLFTAFLHPTVENAPCKIQLTRLVTTAATILMTKRHTDTKQEDRNCDVKPCIKFWL